MRRPLTPLVPDRRRLLRWAALLSLAAPALHPGPAWAGGAVRLHTGAPEGSPADLWARAFAPFLERHLPHNSVEVVARPEGGPVAMLGDLARAPGAIGTVLAPDILARIAASDRPRALAGFRFLAAVTEEPLVLVAAPGTELAALRESGAVLALPPPGSTAALAAEALLHATAAAAVHFPSGTAARLAAQSGNTAAALVRLPDAIGAIRDNRVAALALATAARSDLLPETPTLTELGIPLTAAARRGFVLPPGATAGFASLITAALRDVVADPEYVAQSRDGGMLPQLRDEAAWTAELGLATPAPQIAGGTPMTGGPARSSRISP
ncbi:tripartite tricarboxylate transporter substrate-binding protein [Roseomonas elaeocarpi]|uniref:Tripartite tricarboxylate transporter substrate-binding protein n=1 Tax=Roseomonas elaeocarpi TaxID=907779 RepID=A0ABV6JR81_9PROT